MASRCVTPFKLPAVRVTALDSCGNVQETGTCLSVASAGIVTVEQTEEYLDRVEFFPQNGDGDFCLQRTDPPRLKWINLTLTFCDVDPELANLLTGGALILSDAEESEAIGFRTSYGDVTTVNFGFEGWTRVGNQEVCDNPLYGYLLYPWVVEGTMSDVTFGNDVANFVVTARTQVGSGWGDGPYDVYSSEAVATEGDPLPLPESVSNIDHRLWFTTFMAPPATACGCSDIPLALSVAATGGGSHPATVTIPTNPAGDTVLPADIDWGDASTTTVTTGPTALHNYATAGVKTVTLHPRAYSSQSYVGTVTVV
jgi:hypothetical protein